MEECGSREPVRQSEPDKAPGQRILVFSKFGKWFGVDTQIYRSLQLLVLLNYGEIFAKWIK